MSFTVLRSKAACFTLDLWQTTSEPSASTSKLYDCLQHVNGTSKSNVSDASILFLPDFVSAQNVVRVIEGKIIQKRSEGKQKLLRVSGRFELSRVRVTEGKITVNVWRKSRGNRFWFELARGSSYRESTVASQVVRGTQRDILRKRPKSNSKAWIKLCESILNILGDC